MMSSKENVHPGSPQAAKGFLVLIWSVLNKKNTVGFREEEQEKKVK